MNIALRFPRLAACLMLVVLLTGCQETDATDSELLEQAQRAFAEGRHDEALATMRTLVERSPDDPTTQRIYGEALIAAGQPSLAVWPLVRAMKDPDEAIPAGLMLTRAQIAGGSGADAIETATRVIEIDPENAVAYLLRARAYLSENMEEETIADLDAALERGLEDDTVELVRLYALLGLGEIEQAEALLEELHAQAISEIESNPRRAAALCGATATFAFETGDPELAESRFEACLEDQGLRNRLLVDSAIKFYDERQMYDQGTDILRRRFEAEETNLAARVEYAERLRRSGKRDEAEALLLEASETQSAAWAALVDFYVRNERFADALGALEQAIQANPNPPDSWYMSRADFQIILGRLEEAERSLEQIEIEVHRAVIEGRLLLAKGELEAAAEKLEEAVRMWPDNPDVRYLAGNTYERLGDWAKAMSHFREAARMKPPHVASSRALAEIQKAVGDREGRAFVLHRLLEVDPYDADAIEGLLDAYRASGSRDVVQQMFLRLSRIPNMQGRAVANVARAKARSGGPEAALKAIESSGADLSQPRFQAALEARIGYLAALERSEQAVAELGGLIEKRPDNAVLHALRGNQRLALGDVSGARADFSRALELDPGSLEALMGLAALQEKQGDANAARETLLQAMEIEEALPEHDSEVALALARFELRAGQTSAGRDRLRGILDRHPRHGAAALALMDSLLVDADPNDPPSELVDVARRAALFEASPRARQLSARLSAPNAPAGENS